jgi:uncharacterized protein (TIGR00369 family)
MTAANPPQPTRAFANRHRAAPEIGFFSTAWPARVAGGRVSGKTYGVVSAEDLKSYDGLAFLQAIVAGTLPQAPISQLLGFHLVEVDKGRAAFQGVPAFHHYNPIGSVHGGFAATLLDSALGCAIFSTLLKGDTWTTLELKLNFVRPLSKDTGPVRAEGRLLHRGRTVATSEGDLKDAAGKLFAHATTTCLIFPGNEER